MELNIDKFNPTITELSSLKEEASRITVETPLPQVVEMRKKLVSTRREIEGFGKGLRDEANKFAKAVIAKEKELIEIIEPEETRLKGIEAEVERRAIMEARRQALPIRRESLASIGDGIECTDETLLEMDDQAFTLYKADRITAWQSKEAARIADEQRKLDEERARIARDEEIKREAEERVRREAEERIEAERRAKEYAERKLKEEQERQEREKREASERAERERKEAEERARKEKKRLEKQEAYRAFREGHGWTEDTKGEYREENTGTEILLWKRVGTFTL